MNHLTKMVLGESLGVEIQARLDKARNRSKCTAIHRGCSRRWIIERRKCRSIRAAEKSMSPCAIVVEAGNLTKIVDGLWIRA